MRRERDVWGLDAEITMCPRSVDDAVAAQMLASIRVTPIGGPRAWLLHHRADLAGLSGARLTAATQACTFVGHQR
jgi:hypothetical protein